MVTKVVLGADDPDLWEKLKQIESIDPAVSGGIESIVHGHRLQTRDKSMSMLFSSGYEEVHQIDVGFCVHITDALIDQDWRLTAASLDRTLRFRVAFAGEAGYAARGSRVFDASARCAYIVRPPGESLTSHFRGGATYRYCSLSMTQDYLRKNLGLTDEELPVMLTQYWARRETVMGHFPASKSSLVQAARLFNIRLSRGWHDLAVRAISFELLGLLFQDWQHARLQAHNSIRISAGERGKLLKIREQIKADPAAPITIQEISARLRINRNKLHAGFKHQFGVTLHGFQNELRMQAALRLLQTTEISIAEIGARVGFQEPTNFSAAFKKHFAATPRDIRKTGQFGL